MNTSQKLYFDKLFCHNCKTSFCKECVENHDGFTCNDWLRLSHPEKFKNTLPEDEIINCPKCNYVNIKDKSDMNYHLGCLACGYSFCKKCLANANKFSTEHFKECYQSEYKPLMNSSYELYEDDFIVSQSSSYESTSEDNESTSEDNNE